MPDLHSCCANGGYHALCPGDYESAAGITHHCECPHHIPQAA